MKTVATIGGSDSAGGAGIQADVKAFHTAGIHGACVLTCITAQNTQGVRAIYPLPPDTIKEQIKALKEDFDIGAAKTGMVFTEEAARVVSREMRGVPLVVDPVFVSTTGHSLSSETFKDGLTHHLIPSSFLLTPNIPEAELLCETTIQNSTDAHEACTMLRDMGAQNVLLKGGHMKGDATDFLLTDTRFYSFTLPRLKKETHGSGCTLSAFIAAFLVKEHPLVEAVKKAKRYTWASLFNAVHPGKGVSTMFHATTPLPLLNGEKTDIWVSLQTALHELLSFIPPAYIPEVGMNFAYALPAATTLPDVCAVEGRIVRAGSHAVQVGDCAFGASQHIASIVLTCMNTDPSKRAAVNIAYTPHVIALCRKLGFTTGSFNRDDERPGSSTMEWGTHHVIDTLGYIPDVIWDKGGQGKEAMIRIIGHNPDEVLHKLKQLCQAEKKVK